MENSIFLAAGLTQAQGEVLDFLLENGECRASFITRRINRPRGVVYKVLDDLEKMGLAKRKDLADSVGVYVSEHPAKIEELFERKARELERQRRIFSQVLPDLVSSYNLSSDKPDIRFLEGNEGIRTVIEDTLKSQGEIRTFIDMEALESDPELVEINREYVKKRVKTNTRKKMIVPESDRKYFKDYDTSMTEVRFLKGDAYPFKSGMQIYGNKVSFQTIDKGKRIAVIIEDKNICEMHKLLFEYIWKTLET
ncbi:MAG: helix-turn-helix domain-containing protein [Parcubacteria group bacterium]